jgi:Rrf2 family iron-sulfur cluster assembly transcriptional regulator
MNRETFLHCASFTSVTLLSHKTLLAIAAVVDVALQEGRKISAKALANRQGAAPRSLEPLLRSLVHEGILKGTRGPHGGYELTRDRSAVTLSDILDALDVGEPKDQPKSETVTTIVLPVLSLTEQAFAKALSQITLDDLVRYAKAVEMERLRTKDAKPRYRSRRRWRQGWPGQSPIPGWVTTSWSISRRRSQSRL